MSERETEAQREEVILYLRPNVAAQIRAHSEKSGDAISQICEDIIMEALRVWD